ncbi:tRNA (N6-threonylcarbamoyladenosine(37)-N6)-methyltransferase TrmO [Colwellia sp. D2M02]|uniref:tRNA (N6-threonylcarbamoyladenosine(37)-N6)-methyltransferase TrmO n=1 Tax=Colwellia sp. D2M02 TaxID=2841562 RepID=UPI0020915534|nr:tRNA (N6-threonylcarbamoyladenosine(37)-N6)-methyltransferase TrmO [Colwellia sp. D2M02]
MPKLTKLPMSNNTPNHMPNHNKSSDLNEVSSETNVIDPLAAITLTPIATVVSPYKEKFAIPRQPNLVNCAQGKVVFIGAANNEELLRGIEQFSHLWLIFIFHGTQTQGWKPLVRPPRLGGNKKLGVLATRSTFRPNPIGMSVVKLERVIQLSDGNVELHISGLDLLDGTPIVDIKPYIPYSDALTDAEAGFAQHQPIAPLTVTFNAQAKKTLAEISVQYPQLTLLIEQVLAQDPRPAYKRNKLDDKCYGMTLYDLDIQWQMSSLQAIEVIAILKK